jgi:uncharacterized spore protein YtfJ
MLGHASARTVYGEPVTAAGRTIVPVARVAYGFGGGGGVRARGDGQSGDEGGGGGGGIVATPVGALEISPDGTRFIAFGDKKRLAVALLAGLGLGLLLAGRLSRRPRRS